MSHTATQLALGIKNEIPNALKSKLDYTFVIEKQEKSRKERKQKQKETFVKNREEPKRTKKLLLYVKLLSRIKPLSACL